MNTIQKLTELFARFPGIGPRQAGRFVYFLLSSPHGYRTELISLISRLKDDIKVCTSCFRYHSGKNPLCTVCADTHRDPSLLMLVLKDVELDALERSKSYRGYYFVLGASVPILDKNPGGTIREKELHKAVMNRAASGLTEIILAFPVNPEGEHTANYVRRSLSPLIEKHGLIVSVLGRGLSTGSELEYSDAETIKSAFQNRH